MVGSGPRPGTVLGRQQPLAGRVELWLETATQEQRTNRCTRPEIGERRSTYLECARVPAPSMQETPQRAPHLRRPRRARPPVRAPRRPRHHRALPRASRDAPGCPRGPRRLRQGPHRLRQDHRLRAPHARPHREGGPPPPEGPRARAHPRARLAGAGPARWPCAGAPRPRCSPSTAAPAWSVRCGRSARASRSSSPPPAASRTSSSAARSASMTSTSSSSTKPTAWPTWASSPRSGGSST